MPAGLLIGMVLDRVVGDPRRWHPVAGFGRWAAAVEARAHRDSVGAGALAWAIAVAVPVAATAGLDRRLDRRGRVPRVVLTAAATWAAVGGTQLAEVAGRVDRCLGDGDLDQARAWLPWLVGRDPSDLDADEVARAVVESVAENTADAVVGPLVWGALAGPTGIVAFRAVNTLDAMWGHRSARYARFGRVAARADDVVGWLPSRTTALLTALLAPTVGGSPTAAVRAWRRDARRHPSPNAGPVEATAAGALGVRFGGVVRYGERVEVRGPLGDGRAVGAADIPRAVRLARLVGGAAAVLAAGTALALGRPAGGGRPPGGR